MNYKRLLAGLLSLILCLYVTVPSFAQSDDTDEVTNTVDLTRVQFIIAYYDMSGVVKYYTKFLDSDGRFVMTDTPSDYASLIGYYVRIYGGALPTATGNYSISVRFVSELSGYEYKSMTLYAIKSIGNSISVLNSVTPTWWADGAGGFTANSTVSINSGVSYLQLNSSITGLYAEAGGRVFINFTPVSTSNVELESPTVSDSDTLADISGNTSSLVDSLDEANGTLQEIIQTISNQLAAFWDQLYNYVHLEQLANDNANTDKLINNQNSNTSELIENQDENTQDIIDNLGDNTTNIINNNNDNTDRLIENNNQNTETIVNGYDNSGITEDNDELNNSMQEQAEQEQQIMEQISEPLNDFEFDNPIVQYLSTFQLMGDFLQSLFTGSGGMQDAINLSFLLGIALMVAGLYRFKGGN